MEMLQTLADLKSGDEGIIASLTGDTLSKQRLSAMGIVKGVEVKVGYSSLFGDPRTYTIKGYTICMRKTEAQKINLQ